MSRRIAAVLVLAVIFVGFAVTAEDKTEVPRKSQYIYISATKTDEEAAVSMKVGDQTLVAPKLLMKKGEKTYEIFAKGENVVMRRKSKNGDVDESYDTLAILFQSPIRPVD